jgi:uncharacterized membrane protein YfcA
VLLLPVSIFAVIAYYRAKLLQIKPALLISAGLITGSIGGAQIALNLPDTALKQCYGLFLIYVGWRFLEPRKLWASQRGKTIPAVPKADTVEPVMLWYVMLGVGLLAGIASGLFGIGGGLVIVPALMAMHYDQKSAVGTSLAALLPPVALGAVLSYYVEDKIDLAVAFFIALGLILGAFGGAKIALGLPSSTIKRLYGAFLLIVSLRFILQL